MRSLFSFEKVKYEPPISGMPRRPTIISTESVTGPFGPSTVTCCAGSSREQVAQPAQLVRVVPVHPHAEADRLLRLHRRVGQHALLAQADELGDAEASMSRLLVKPSSRSTLTSTHRPWQSKPFW